MYSDLPPAAPEKPVVFDEDPVIDTMDRVHALESAFLVLAVALLEADVISVDHLKRQLWNIATETEGPERQPVGAYLDKLVSEISGALRLRRQQPPPSGIRYREWQEQQDGFDAKKAELLPKL